MSVSFILDRGKYFSSENPFLRTKSLSCLPPFGMNENDLSWHELVSKKEEFLHILRILNHYYEMRGETKSKQFGFRRLLADSDPNSVQIFFAKIGPFEYQVACRILPNEETETWIHVDGIAEERERLRQIGNTEHPVFSLVCLGDLFSISVPTLLSI
ncbi:LIC_13246 family protein [Leptospira levettii]|uniref:LIC_13246 family protein n=1 Tax=Leptospira levettii TaxID=2023178 RepID=UPI001FF015FB|nr:hypothetical protein [Leptospira levettii]